MKLPRLALLLLAAAPAAAHAQDVIIPFNQQYSWLSPTDGVDPASIDPGGDFSNTWYSFTGYDGPAFTENAPAPLQYGGISYLTANAITSTVLPTPPSGSRFTAYFKTQFTATQDYLETSAEMLADDGAVIYLDGVEIKRLNMAAGGDYGSFSDGVNRTEDGISTEVGLITIALGPISAGPHTLAISVHNSSSDSSDLGFHMRVIGAPPPPPVVLKRDIAGVSTDVLMDGPLSGWAYSVTRPGAYAMNGVAAEATVTSLPVDLSTVGAVNFVLSLYAGEDSDGSNFETTDNFRARLETVLDDDSAGEINLIPAELDLNQDGALNGDEIQPVADIDVSIHLSRHLTATIPANVKSVRLIVSGVADSTSEYLRWGGARITDTDPLSDEDADGSNRQDEYLAGTNPTDASSVFRLDTVEFTPDPVSPLFRVGGNTLVGTAYAYEYSFDGETWDFFDFYIPTAANQGYGVVFNGTAPEFFVARLRVVP